MPKTTLRTASTLLACGGLLSAATLTLASADETKPAPPDRDNSADVQAGPTF